MVTSSQSAHDASCTLCPNQATVALSAENQELVAQLLRERRAGPAADGSGDGGEGAGGGGGSGVDGSGTSSSDRPQVKKSQPTLSCVHLSVRNCHFRSVVH